MLAGEIFFLDRDEDDGDSTEHYELMLDPSPLGDTALHELLREIRDLATEEVDNPIEKLQKRQL